MTPEQQVPTLETCKLLKEAGYPQNTSCFAFFQLNEEEEILLLDREMIISLVGKPDGESGYVMIADAPTLQELLEELVAITHTGDPSALPIRNCTPRIKGASMTIIEKVADNIEQILEQKQLGNCSADNAREQLERQLIYLTQAQRKACLEATENAINGSEGWWHETIYEAILGAKI